MLTAGTPLGSPDGICGHDWCGQGSMKAGVLEGILDKHRLITSGIFGVYTVHHSQLSNAVILLQLVFSTPSQHKGKGDRIYCTVQQEWKGKEGLVKWGKVLTCFWRGAKILKLLTTFYTIPVLPFIYTIKSPLIISCTVLIMVQQCSFAIYSQLKVCEYHQTTQPAVVECTQ